MPGREATREDAIHVILKETTVCVTASPGHRDRSEVLGNKEP
jgi:hypothetical protein